jgi:beta-glucuronidase
VLKRLLLSVVSLLIPTAAQAAQTIDLNGSGWKFRTTLEVTAKPVTVPHCWLVQKGYENYLGHAFYERDFEMPAIPAGKAARIHFDAVYEASEIWVNGKLAGTHDGGYSAFEFDITRLVHPGTNHILVNVDNEPTFTSIPALATGHPSTDVFPVGGAGKGTIVGWLPYGGIVRPVNILIGDAVHFRNIKIDADPNLQSGEATLTVRATLKNDSDKVVAANVSGEVASLKTVFKSVRVPANGEINVSWKAVLRGAHLWSVRDPFLYDAHLAVGDDEFHSHVGVRKIQVDGTRLLLNGREVHLNGANRVSDDPKEGLRESDEVIQRDMNDMLADNMRMMRIAHYPEAQAVLDFADQHGMLLIPEAGNWNMSGWQMADPGIRARWKMQMKEMMEQDWNHPSVVAWSVGNEYESYKKEGIDWTRDMRAYTLGLDSTHLITFASRYTSDPAVKTGTDEASQFTDFVSVNVYGDYAKRFDRAHALFPNKPIFVTEFGKTGEPGTHDPERIANITEAMKAIKERPYMIGASLWTWNDYRSFISGTPADGIRKWGVVNVQREHRDSWKAVHDLFATELP